MKKFFLLFLTFATLTLSANSVTKVNFEGKDMPIASDLVGNTLVTVYQVDDETMKGLKLAPNTAQLIIEKMLCKQQDMIDQVKSLNINILYLYVSKDTMVSIYIDTIPDCK